MSYENLKRIFDPQNYEGTDIEVINPKEEPESPVAEKPPLNGLWHDAVFSFWTIKRECSIPYVACGTARVIPSERLSDLFGVDRTEQELMVTVAMGEPGDSVYKTAQVMAKMGRVVVNFYIESINDEKVYERKVIQTRIENGEMTSLAGTDKEDTAYLNYESTIDVVRRVKNWEKPTNCKSCPINNFDNNPKQGF